MRRLLSVFASGALAFFILLGTPVAQAAGAGQIDHVETNPSGAVKMLYSVPNLPDGVSLDLKSVAVTVAGKPVKASASPVRTGEVQRTAVLAIDVSESMRGARFEAAKRAALVYIDTAPEDLAVGLVTFAGSVAVAEPPTTDRDRLRVAVTRLTLSRGTLLHDGIISALDQVGESGLRQVVVLSDGADTGDTSLADVVARARRSGTTVNVVALQQSTGNETRLRAITDATEGTVIPADDPAALSALFADQAAALAGQVLIEFDAPTGGEATVTAAMAADGTTYADSAFVSLPRMPQSSTQAEEPVPVAPPDLLVDARVLYVGLGALAVGLAAVTGLLLVGTSASDLSRVQRQLAFYSQSSTTPPSAPNGTKAQLDVRGAAVAVASHVVKGGGLEERITRRLTSAGLALTAAEWLLMHAGIAVVAGLTGLVVSGGSLLSTGLLLLLGVVVPWLFLSVKESRRLKAFSSQLADTLQLMSGGLSAGLSLPQAVDTVVREGTEPMAGELRRALVEQRLGVDIEDALDGVADRMQSKDFGWVVMAIRIQREIGGNLAELIDTVAHTIREREYLRRQVKTLSAEGRLSAWVVGGLPPLFLVYLVLTQPDFLAPLYTTTIGLLMSGVAGVLMVMGVFGLKVAVKVEV